MYGVPIIKDDFVDNASLSPHGDAPLKISPKDSYAGSNNFDPLVSQNDASPLPTLKMQSSQVEHVPPLVNNGNSDLLNRIELMKMRSRGIYAPVRDHLHASLDLDKPHSSSQQERGMDNINSDAVGENIHYPVKHDVHGPFAVPSAAACRRHRRKSYDKPS